MGQEFASLTSWLLSANCRVAVRPQMYRRESRVLYELIFVAFDCFRILLMHEHLLILTHITLTYMMDSIASTASEAVDTKMIKLKAFHPICDVIASCDAYF